jgi:hypothetical protein
MRVRKWDEGEEWHCFGDYVKADELCNKIEGAHMSIDNYE